MGKWIFGGLFIGIASIFIAIGVYGAASQHLAIRNAEPTTAVIESSSVQVSTRRSGRSRSRSRSVEIAYKYLHNDTWLVGHKVYPFGMDFDDPSELVNRFRAGSEVPAFFDRRNPNSAFLLKRHSFAPYLFILFPMLHVAVGFAVVAGIDSKTARLPQFVRSGAGAGSFHLAPQNSIRRKLMLASTLTALWWGVGGAALGHYFSTADRPYGMLPLVAGGIYAGIGLFPLLTVVHYWRLSGRVSDAVVTLDRHPVTRGEPVRVRINVPIAGGGSVEAATVTLQCRRTVRTRSGGKSRIETETAWEQQQAFARAQDILADRNLSGEVTFIPPADQPPGTPRGARGYPRHQWRLQVHVKQPGPDYKSNFTIDVA